MKKILLLLSPLILYTQACSDERIKNTGSQREKEVEMVLSLPHNSLRRSVIDAENAIKSIHLLVFDGSAGNTDEATFLYSRYAFLKVANTYRTVLKIGEGLDIYFAVNVADLVTSDEITEGMTWSQVREKLILTRPDNIDVNSNGLPMWGYLHNYTVKDQSYQTLGVIHLLRAVASTDIKITASNFTLKKGHVVFGADKGYLAFSPSNTTVPDANGNFYAKSPEVPLNMQDTVEWSYAVSSDAVKEIQNKFYMYDNDAPEGGKRFTKIILEGRLDGSSKDTFYPIAFRKAGTETKLKVTRNNKYEITITSVNGDGFPDIESAKDGDDVNMEYKVIPWDFNQDTNIYVDGTKYISLDSKKATLKYLLGSLSEIKFSTNIKLADIKMKFEGNAEESKYVIDSHERFKVEVLSKEEEKEPYFRISAKQGYGTTYNPATLIVTAGRICFKIEITQLDKDPSDWEDGGNEEVDV